MGSWVCCCDGGVVDVGRGEREEEARGEGSVRVEDGRGLGSPEAAIPTEESASERTLSTDGGGDDKGAEGVARKRREWRSVAAATRADDPLNLLLAERTAACRTVCNICKIVKTCQMVALVSVCIIYARTWNEKERDGDDVAGRRTDEVGCSACTSVSRVCLPILGH